MKSTVHAHIAIGIVFVASISSAAAAPTYFNVSVDDYAALKINDVVIASYDDFPWGGAYGSVDLTLGWYPIELTYQNRWGSTALRLYDRLNESAAWEYVPAVRLRSFDAGGLQVNGLRADYSLLDGTSLGTVYGEGPIAHGWFNLYEGASGQWAGGLVDTNWGNFQERLTGEIHINAVPEPMTWAMLSVGLGVLGFTIARRRHRT